MASSLVETPGTLRPLLRLSLPVMAEQVLHLLVGLSDLALTGRFLEGSAFVAAMTVVIYLLWLIGMLFAFIATGATPLVARFTGSGDPALADRVMNQSITVGLGWTAVLMAIGFPLAASLVGVMGLDGASADAATRYLVIELCVLPAIMIERVGIACLRGAGDTVSGLLTMAVVNVVNIGVSFSLLTGAGGWWEPMGWEGVAYGTAAGHLTGATILLAMLLGGRAGFHLRLSKMVPDPTLIRRLLRVGVPGGFEAVLLVICNLAYLRIVVALGDIEAAAHGVAIQVEALAFMPGGAFQIAASTMAGQYLGASLPDRATRSVLVAVAAAATLMMAMGVVFWFSAEDLIGLFMRDKPEVVALAVRLLRVISVAMLPLAIAMVLSGALRGAGDTRWALAFTVLSMCLVRIPLATYLAHDVVDLPFGMGTLSGAGLGAVGAWCGASTDLIVRASLLTARFVHGGWRRIEV